MSNPTVVVGLLIFSCFLVLYVSSYTGVFRVDDEHILAARTQSLALWKRFEEPQVYGNERVQALIPYGDPATQIEPAQTLLGAGLYKIGVRLGVGGAQTMFMLNLYLTALTVAGTFLLVLLIGYSTRTAIWSAVLFGSATMAWPYAMTYYRDVLTMLMACLVFLGWTLSTRVEGVKRRWGIFTLAVGFLGGVLSKNTFLAMAPALALAFAFRHLSEARSSRSKHLDLLSVIGFVSICLLLLSFISPQGPLARFSLDYYSSLLRHFLQTLSPHTILALFGPLLSPSKSILLFSPPLIFAILGARSSWSKSSSTTLLCLSFPIFLSLGQALFYGEMWAGTFGWGLRYMLPVLPGLIAVGAASIEPLLGQRLLKRTWLYGVLAVGILIQIGGVLLPWHAIYLEWQSHGLDPFQPQASWDPRFFPIPAHIGRVLDSSRWVTAWLRVLSEGDQLAAIIPASLIGGGVLLILVVWYAKRRLKSPSAHWLGFLPMLVTWILPVYPTLSLLRGDPYWGGTDPVYEEVQSEILSQISEEDIVIVDSYGTTLWRVWMNRWDHPAIWISLPFEVSLGIDENTQSDSRLSEDTQSLFQGFDRKYRFLWYLLSDEAPDFAYRNEVQWLDENYPTAWKQEFQGKSIIELHVYDLGP